MSYLWTRNKEEKLKASCQSSRVRWPALTNSALSHHGTYRPRIRRFVKQYSRSRHQLYLASFCSVDSESTGIDHPIIPRLTPIWGPAPFQYPTMTSIDFSAIVLDPQADAIGCAGKYSRGDRPEVFFTELVRSVRSGGDILYGMINCRTDGNNIVLAQMKEARKGSDVWDSYLV